MRANLFIEAFITVEVPADTLVDAVEKAKKLSVSDIIKVKKGSADDWSITVLGVDHEWPNFGDAGE